MLCRYNTYTLTNPVCIPRGTRGKEECEKRTDEQKDEKKYTKDSLYYRKKKKNRKMFRCNQ